MGPFTPSYYALPANFEIRNAAVLLAWIVTAHLPPAIGSVAKRVPLASIRTWLTTLTQRLWREIWRVTLSGTRVAFQRFVRTTEFRSFS
jgi:hypothetical protein